MIRRMLCFIVLLTTVLLAACKEKELYTYPEDFAISYTFWTNENNKNILDTYQGRIQKDMIADGVIQAEYQIDEEGLEEIYNKLNELKLQEITDVMTSTNLSTTNSYMIVTPCIYYDITFTMNGTSYHITGDASASSYRNQNEQADAFCSFLYYMNRFMEATEEYQSFPKASGGYD